MDRENRENREHDEIVLRVTAHYVEEVQAGHKPAISDYLARYPQYADAIAAFIAYYRTVELPLSQLTGSADFTENADNSGNTNSTDEFADEFHIAVESAWQRVMTPELASKSGDVGKIDHRGEVGESGEIKEAEEGVEVVYGQPIQSIFIVAKQQRLSPSQLAAYLNISEDIVTLLDQRALAPESIPLELRRRLAVTLHQPMQAVQSYLGMRHRQQVAEQSGEYIVEDIEDAGNMRDAARLSQKVSFREALDNSGKLSVEQTNFWRDVLAKEGL
jgi:hypothetical protein